MSYTSSYSRQASLAVAGITSAAALSKLVYRSRAVRPLSARELRDLALAAQVRNSAEAVTGLMLHDDDSFFQWLEGPVDSVDRIMGSIRNDRRHTNIEVLDSRPADARVFADWNMKLASTGQAAMLWHDVVEPPLRIITDLRQNPKAAPILLAALNPAPAKPAGTVREVRSRRRVPFNQHAAALLKAVIVETVIPGMAAEHGVRRTDLPKLPFNKRVGELADLLIGADQGASLELIREVQGETIQPLLHYATLFEPVARRLGDLWGEDSCTEFDVTLGLSRIETAVRLLNSGGARRCAVGAPGPDVLIAPEPGEMHRLSAVLDTEVMWNAGWTPHFEHPCDDQALEDLVAGTWFDVLDLSLSAAFRRDHWLPRMKKTIAAARLASRNPALVVLAGGRLFAEHRATGAQVGADSASATAVHIDQSIRDRLLRAPAAAPA